MNTTMADGASERLDAQIADALFGQPGISKLDVANRLRQLRGDGGALLGSAAYPAAWMWPHPEDGSVRFTADGDVATEAANIGRSVAALYRVPVLEDAQPSPAGQGDATFAFSARAKKDALEAGQYAFTEADGKDLGYTACIEACVEAICRVLEMPEHRAALAARQPISNSLIAGLRDESVFSKAALLERVRSARQPVAAAVKDSLTAGAGQPVGDGWSGWATQYPGKMPKLYGAREIAEVNRCPEEGERLIFLSEQPAQAVDLGQFRPAVCAMGLYAEEPEDVDEAKRLLALIDSKAVGNG